MSQPIDLIALQHAVAIHRDEKAYGTLFIHYYHPLTCFALSIVKSKEAAEEIYSDVMMKLWDLAEALDKIENLQVYLFVLVKNASLNYVSRYYKLKTVDLNTVSPHLVAAQNNFEDDFLDAEFRKMIAASVTALPPKCAMVYQLIKVYGLNYKQVAQVMDISVNTVEGHMTSALKKITQSLRSYLLPGNN